MREIEPVKGALYGRKMREDAVRSLSKAWNG